MALLRWFTAQTACGRTLKMRTKASSAAPRMADSKFLARRASVAHNARPAGNAQQASGADDSSAIADLVGHAGTKMTEKVYRFELRPVIAKGAETMNDIFGDTEEVPTL